MSTRARHLCRENLLQRGLDIGKAQRIEYFRGFFVAVSDAPGLRLGTTLKDVAHATPVISGASLTVELRKLFEQRGWCGRLDKELLR